MVGEAVAVVWSSRAEHYLDARTPGSGVEEGVWVCVNDELALCREREIGFDLYESVD